MAATAVHLGAAATDAASMNPLGAIDHIKALKQLVLDPQVDQAIQAADKWKSGDRSEAVGHALAAILPGVGPAAANIGEKLGSGDLTGAAADATTLGITMAAPHVAGALRGALPDKVTVVPPLVRPLDPLDQANQQWMASQGLQTPLAMQTSSPSALDIQSSVARSPGGGALAERQQALKQELIDRGKRELSKIQFQPVTPEEAGAAVSEQLASNLQKTRSDLAAKVLPAETTPEEAGAGLRNKLASLLDQTRSGLASEVSPTPSSPEIAGGKVLEAGKAAIRNLDKQADQSYKAAWQAEKHPGNIEQVPVRDDEGNQLYNADGSVTTEKMALPIDMADVQDALEPLARRYERTLSDTDVRASLGLKSMRNILNESRFKPASVAETDLGMLKDAARTEKGLAELRDPSQGLAAASVAQLQQAIDAKMATAFYPGWDPASGTPSPALDNLQAGRRATAQKHDIADAYAGFGNRNLEKIEPVSVYRGLTWAGDAGVERLRNIARIAPDAMAHVGRAFIDSGGDWNTLGPGTKNVIFHGDNNLINSLDNYYAQKEQFGGLTEKEPVGVYGEMTRGRDANIEQMRAIAQVAPDQMPAIGRAFIDSGGKWDALGPESKKVLFKDPKLIGQLDQYYAKQQQFGPLTQMDPEALANKLMASKGRAITQLRAVAQETPEQMPGLFRSFVEGIFNRATREGDLQKVQGTLDGWLDMPEEAKALMVKDPKVVDSLNNLFFAMKRLARNPNTSGTSFLANLNRMKGNIFTGLGTALGAVGGGTHGGYAEGAGLGGLGAIAGVGAEVGANKALARLLTNQKFINLMTQGIQMDLRGDTAGAQLTAKTLSRMASAPDGSGDRQK
jgi:hypothetical protein